MQFAGNLSRDLPRDFCRRHQADPPQAVELLVKLWHAHDGIDAMKSFSLTARRYYHSRRRGRRLPQWIDAFHMDKGQRQIIRESIRDHHVSAIRLAGAE